MSVLDRDARVVASAAKIRPPFALDPGLCFYSPQENVDAFDHPRVAAWLSYVRDEWEPRPALDTSGRIGLLIPCTKYKPYPTSREHRAINGALLGAGWEPVGDDTVPDGLADVLDDGEDPALLHVGPLRRGDVLLERFVVSEPLALVPYEHVYRWRGEASPATAYDDPGLFESRGTSVSPHRADNTAVAIGGGRWRWGPAERDAYVDAHDRLVEVIGATLSRVADHYDAIVAWVSPGLTHRSFLADRQRRRDEGLAAARVGRSGRRQLRGVLDEHPGLVELLPTREQRSAAVIALAQRLADEGRPATAGAVRAVYARGDGNDTPLGLPESLTHLVATLDRAVEAAR